MLNLFRKSNIHQQATSSKKPDFVSGIQHAVRKLTKVHEIKTCILKDYSQVTKVADYVKDGESVIVNLHNIEENKFFRSIDFLSGTVYGINGNIEKIGEKGTKIYLLTPKSVILSPELRKTLTVSIDNFK